MPNDAALLSPSLGTVFLQTSGSRSRPSYSSRPRDICCDCDESDLLSSRQLPWLSSNKPALNQLLVSLNDGSISGLAEELEDQQEQALESILSNLKYYSTALIDFRII